MHRADDQKRLRIHHYFTKSEEEWYARGRFWATRDFNKRNGTRLGWQEPPHERWSAVKDDYARTLKARVAASPTAVRDAAARPSSEA